MDKSDSNILIVNRGSSTIKFALYSLHQKKLTEDYKSTIELGGNRSVDSTPDNTLLSSFLSTLRERIEVQSIRGVGHRLVQGGNTLYQPVAVNSVVIKELENLIPINPTHLPGEIELIKFCSTHFPAATQIACFDTAFHHTLPDVAKTIPVPYNFQTPLLRRYGFHGLSYSFLLSQLAATAGEISASGKVIFAHLGSGCSLAATNNGRCIDTTMGFTPTGGLIMGRRSGDLDPGVIVYLLKTYNLSADDLQDLLNNQSGMKSVTTGSTDMRDLIELKNQGDSSATSAIDLFCYSAAKQIGALTAALGGIDTFVFSGGIGENSPVIRSEICSRLKYLGFSIESTLNETNADIISTSSSAVAIRVIKTDEELEIARTVIKFI